VNPANPRAPLPVSLDIHFLTDQADPRLEDFRELKDRPLREDSGKFVAESEPVVRRLLASRLRVHSLAVTAPRLAALEEALAPGVPIYVVPQAIMDQVAGFHVHRGCLAIGERPRDAQIPAEARTVVVLEDLVDVDNLGAMARNAAALGADALVLSPRCADPYYRKAIRVSMGAVFFLPVVRASRWPEDLMTLRDQHGLCLVGAVLDPGAIPLPRFRRPERLALLLGAEGPGLRTETRRLCDHLVTVPMASARADSLNVATAGAIFLYGLLPP
jgi:tRNA G18 (ribose-2'-O)-methylase SpoU